MSNKFGEEYHACCEIQERGPIESAIRSVELIVNGSIGVLCSNRFGEQQSYDPALDISYGKELLRQSLEMLKKRK